MANVIALLAFVVMAATSADVRSRALGESLIIHDVTVIDGTGAPPRPHADVVIRDGRIMAVADSVGYLHPPKAHVLNASGRFLIPGLVDMHAHVLGLTWDEQGNLERHWNRGNTLLFLHDCLRFGVTTVRDPGAVTENAVLVRSLLRKGQIEGPTLFVAGRILNSSSFDPDPFAVVRTENEIREEVRWQAHSGVDVIKIYSSMTPEQTAIAIDEAHRSGLPIIGHLQRTSWTEAARLNIDGVEHAAPWSLDYVTEQDRAHLPDGMLGRVFWLEHLDNRKIDEMITELVKHHVVVDPTLMATMQTKFWGNDKRWLENPDLAYVPEGVRKGWLAGSFVKDWTAQDFERAQKSWPILLSLIKRMYERGVLLVVGTDTPTPWIVPGASVHDEMRLLVEAGIPPSSVLQMATQNAARALRQQDEFGTIRPGLRADLVLLTKNPLESIENTRSIEIVFQGGRIAVQR